MDSGGAGHGFTRDRGALIEEWSSFDDSVDRTVADAGRRTLYSALNFSASALFQVIVASPEMKFVLR